MEHADAPPSFLPRPEHVAYLANLFTVLAVLVGGYVILRRERARKRGNVTMGPGWRAS